MPATLSEAFGENFDIVPNNNQRLNKKKKNKNKNTKNSRYHHLDQKPEFGHYLSDNSFGAPEQSRYIKAEIPALGDQQFQSITNNEYSSNEYSSNDYGPTDYSIKPVGANEYAFDPYQMDNNIEDLEEDIEETNLPVRKNVAPKPESFSNSENVMDPRMSEFSNKLDLILEKLKDLDEPVQENIHDIILFVIFGIFVIFIMDSIYRVGKVTF